MDIDKLCDADLDELAAEVAAEQGRRARAVLIRDALTDAPGAAWAVTDGSLWRHDELDVSEATGWERAL